MRERAGEASMATAAQRERERVREGGLVKREIGGGWLMERRDIWKDMFFCISVLASGLVSWIGEGTDGLVEVAKGQ